MVAPNETRAADGAPPRAPADEERLPAELVELLALAWAHLRSLQTEAKGLLRLRAAGVALNARQTVLRATCGLLLLLAASVATVAGVLTLVRGTRGALTALSGAPWFGDLGAGLLVLAATGLAGWRAWERLDARWARRIEERFGAAPTTPEEPPA